MAYKNTNYPDNWNKIRKKALNRDGHKCRKCGNENVELHVHHIIPVSEEGSDSLENLKTVCHSCHEDIHGHPIPTPESNNHIDSLCENSSQESYKCSRCKKTVQLPKRGIRCVYCGHRIFLKGRNRDVKVVDVK